MKITSFTVHAATKFNDPHEQYRNHSVGTELRIELAEGENLDETMETARVLVRNTVDQERAKLLERCRLQYEFEQKVRGARSKLRNMERYEQDTKTFQNEKEDFERDMEGLRQLAEKLGSMNVFVQVPVLAIGNGSSDDE